MKKFLLCLGVLGVVLAMASVATAQTFQFRAGLSGDQEVSGPSPVAPQGVDTDTTGRARFSVDRAFTRMSFIVEVFDGVAITQAHLHCAPAGANGSIAVFLFDVAPIPGPGGIAIDGILAQGTLTNADIEPGIDFASNEACGVPINNIASLVAAMLAGRIYVNVHSEEEPSGVVRGQVASVRIPTGHP